MLKILQYLGDCLRAIPGPTEHWAEILSSWAWPAAFFVTVYGLRRPIKLAAERLAKRFETDDLELGGFLKMTGAPVSTLDRSAVTEEADTAEAEDVHYVERLLEYAAESEESAMRLIDWIGQHAGPQASMTEDFFTEATFAEARRLAYRELVEGAANGQ